MYRPRRRRPHPTQSSLVSPRSCRRRSRGGHPVPGIAAAVRGALGPCRRGEAAGLQADQLKPELGAVMVNQGLNYPILNRGKQTLVRLFLRLPTTCTAGSTITMTGASLTVTLTDLSGTPLSGTTATVSPIRTVSGNLTAALQTNAASDPALPRPGEPAHPVGDDGLVQGELHAPRSRTRSGRRPTRA